MDHRQRNGPQGHPPHITTIIVFPQQVRNKAMFYRRQAPEVCAEINEWARAGYFNLSRPYHVERHFWLPAWIEQYKGPRISSGGPAHDGEHPRRQA